MAGTESILGQYEANASISSTAGTDRVATDKDTFLKLLVAQLTHQDPLNPVEDKEFIAQLAQFTTVEELQNMNKGMESLNSAYLREQSVNAAGLIGRYIQAPGDMVSIVPMADGKTYVSAIDYNMPRDASSAALHIYSLDAEGNPTGKMVASRDLRDLPGASLAAGNGTAPWDGLDNSGAALPAGTYSATIVAKDLDGQDIYPTISSTGRVIRVEVAADGNHKLVLHDGRSVNFNDVKVVDDAAIYETPAASTGEDEAGGGGTNNDQTDGGATG